MKRGLIITRDTRENMEISGPPVPRVSSSVKRLGIFPKHSHLHSASTSSSSSSSSFMRTSHVSSHTSFTPSAFIFDYSKRSIQDKKLHLPLRQNHQIQNNNNNNNNNNNSFEWRLSAPPHETKKILYPELSASVVKIEIPSLSVTRRPSILASPPVAVDLTHCFFQLDTESPQVPSTSSEEHEENDDPMEIEDEELTATESRLFASDRSLTFPSAPPCPVDVQEQDEQSVVQTVDDSSSVNQSEQVVSCEMHKRGLLLEPGSRTVESTTKLEANETSKESDLPTANEAMSNVKREEPEKSVIVISDSESEAEEEDERKSATEKKEDRMAGVDSGKHQVLILDDDEVKQVQDDDETTQDKVKEAEESEEVQVVSNESTDEAPVLDVNPPMEVSEHQVEATKTCSKRKRESKVDSDEQDTEPRKRLAEQGDEETSSSVAESSMEADHPEPNVIVSRQEDTEKKEDGLEQEQKKEDRQASGLEDRKEKAKLLLEIMILKRRIQGLHLEKVELERQGVEKLEEKVTQLNEANKEKTRETEQLRLSIEELATRLVQAEQRQKQKEAEAASLAQVVWKEKSDRERAQEMAKTMSNQLAGAENEAYRLQSQLQDEARRRSALERESERIRFVVQTAFHQSSTWEANISSVLDAFDKNLNSIDRKTRQLQQAMSQYKKSRLHRDAKFKTQRCVACFSEPISVCYIPCGHRSVCPACDVRIDTCPVCRCFIRERVRTYDAGVD